MRHIRTSFTGFLALALGLFGQENTPAKNEDWIRQGVAQQQVGNYAGAADAYSRALAAEPNDVATQVNLGVVLVKLGRFDEAIAHYAAAEKLLPGDSRIGLNVALAYGKSGRLLESVKLFEKLHAAAPQEQQITMLLADGDLQLGRYQQVVDLLQPLAAQNAQDPAIAYMLGSALLRTGRIGEGQVFIDRILRNVDTPEARLLLGTRMIASGDYPAAVKQLRSALTLNPNFPRSESLYGRALLNTGDADGAAEAFRHELATNPNDFDANLFLAQILNARRQYRGAAPLAKRACELHPDDADGKVTLAESLNGNGEFSEALPYAEAAVRAMPESAHVHRTLAISERAVGKASDSAREFRMAASLEEATDPAPRIGQQAPDFELVSSDASTMSRLRDFRTERKPVVLVFGSYSCPNFRSSVDSLTSLYRRYGSSIPFLLIYIREAHAAGDWQSSRNEHEGIAITPAKNFGEKEEHASMCSRKLHLPFPSLVDGMDDATEKAYNAWPSRLFIVARDGRIAYNTRLTELDFHAAEIEAVLRELDTRR